MSCAKEYYSTKDLGKEIKLGHDSISAQFKFLQGKVLTVIDASVSDPRQLKAIKDLVNTAFSNQMAWCYQLCWPETRMITADEANATISDLPEKLKE